MLSGTHELIIEQAVLQHAFVQPMRACPARLRVLLQKLCCPLAVSFDCLLMLIASQHSKACAQHAQHADLLLRAGGSGTHAGGCK